MNLDTLLTNPKVRDAVLEGSEEVSRLQDGDHVTYRLRDGGHVCKQTFRNHDGAGRVTARESWSFVEPSDAAMFEKYAAKRAARSAG